MTDKPVTTPEKEPPSENGTLFDAAYDAIKSTWDKATAANEDKKTTESLPAVKLVDSKAETTVDAKLASRTEAKDDAKAESKPDTKTETGPKAVLSSSESSQEMKLKAASELAASGEDSFEGTDGRKYYISRTEVGSRDLVSIHTRGDDGKSHAVLRGVVGDNGAVSKQKNAQGHEVSYATEWAEKSLKESTLLKGNDRVDSGEEFLLKHPELIRSPEQLAKLQTQRDEAVKKIEGQSAELKQKREEFVAEAKKLEEDLASVNVKDFKNRAEMIEQLKRVGPPEKRAELATRIDKLGEHNEDIQDAERMIGSRKRHVHDLDEKLKFNDDLKQIDKLPKDKRDAIYQNLDKILDQNDKTQTTDLTESERKRIVRDLVHQVAHPEDIKQGNKDTCALASSEYVLAKDHPEIYVRTVTEWATAGELTTYGDKCVPPGKGTKISPEQIHNYDGNPERTLASKVFQTGAATMAIESQGLRYENHNPGEAPPLASGKTPVDDSGERIITQAGEVRDWNGLYPKQQVELLNKLTKETYRAEQLYAETPADFQKELEANGEKNGYPIKVSFRYSDGSGHATTITGIDKSTTPATVIYEDPAQPRGGPQKLPMDKFYNVAMDAVGQYAAGGMKIQVLHTGDMRHYVTVIHDGRK